MYNNKEAILIFGVGPLQKSIIERAKLMGLYTVGIDPSENANCRHDVDAFELVGGQDFEGTCNVVEQYGIDAIVTAATDKPLVMMARIAEKYGFPFFSVETAIWSTDKYHMKQRFIESGIPCAKGRLVKSVDEVNDFELPVIVKPRDNSGSRGVKLCRSKEDLVSSINEAFEVSRLDSVLVEEFIEGKEYSIESLHYDKKNKIIQYTEKSTTPFPYNVELGHIQPANISNEDSQKINEILNKIGIALHFNNCPSHTEIKINNRGIFVIETSPRLGGDYITSTLTPISTGVNMEDLLIRIALSEKINPNPQNLQYAGVRFFSFKEGSIVKRVPKKDIIKDLPYLVEFSFKLKKDERVNRITSSLNRYGHLILQANSRDDINDAFAMYEKILSNYCF